jgi:hypothetical protein
MKPIYLKDIIEDPSILDNLFAEKKEERFDDVFEKLGELVEEHPIVGPHPRIRS